MDDKRTILSREVKNTLEEIAKQIGTKVFKTTIRRCISVKEAQTKRELLLNYKPDCTSAKDYIKLVDEFINEE